MHILLIRFSSLGDVVLQTATVNWLRSLLGPEARFTFITASEFVPLLEDHPQVQAVIGFDRKNGDKWKNLIRRIDDINRQHPINVILDLHATLRSFRLKLSFWKIPSLSVDKRRWERLLLTKIKNVKVKRIFNKKIFGLEPQVERIIRDFEGIFHDSRGKRRTSEFRNGPHEEMTSLTSNQVFKLSSASIVLAPSASFFYKRWPVEKFVELARHLLESTTFDIVILAGSQDDFCQAFDKIESTRLLNLQGKTSLKESMSVLSQAKICIGNDSGMNHIAEAYGVPCLTIFGPTDPRFGFTPHGNASRYLSKDMFCKPCSTTGKKACYRDRHYCMEEITVEEVKRNVLEMLQ